MSGLQVFKVGETTYWTSFHVVFLPEYEDQNLTSSVFSICNNLAQLNLEANRKDYNLYVRACIKSSSQDHFLFQVYELSHGYYEYPNPNKIEDGPGYQDILSLWARSRDGPYSFGFKIQFVKQISSRFKDLYEDAYTDYELLGGAGDTEATGVRVHRSVLAATSSVLRDALRNGPPDGAQRMTLEYATTETLQHFTAWIYKCEVPMDAGACARLLSLAGRVDAPALVAACTAQLAAQLAAVNLWDVLQAATHRRDHRILLALLETIDRQKAGQLRDQFRKEDAAAAKPEAEQEVANAGAADA